MYDSGGTETPWYVRSFGGLYPLLYSHRDDGTARREIAALLSVLDLRGDERILDLCCGAGRHTAALADLGFDVAGLDLSPDLLHDAARRPFLAQSLVRGDMRRLPFPSGEKAGFGFDVVLNLFTSFGYFAAEDENEAAFREMARVLKPGGILVVDHINRERLKRDIVPESAEERGGFLIRSRRSIRDGRIEKETEVSEAKGEGRTARFFESVRLYTPSEFEGLCRTAGLGPASFIGSFAGDPFGPDSERMILVARKESGERRKRP